MVHDRIDAFEHAQRDVLAIEARDPVPPVSPVNPRIGKPVAAAHTQGEKAVLRLDPVERTSAIGVDRKLRQWDIVRQGAHKGFRHMNRDRRDGFPFGTIPTGLVTLFFQCPQFRDRRGLRSEQHLRPFDKPYDG